MPSRTLTPPAEWSASELVPLSAVPSVLAARYPGTPRLSPSAVRRWAQAGIGPDRERLPTITVGMSRFTTLDAVDDYVDRMRLALRIHRRPGRFGARATPSTTA